MIMLVVFIHFYARSPSAPMSLVILFVYVWPHVRPSNRPTVGPSIRNDIIVSDVDLQLGGIMHNFMSHNADPYLKWPCLAAFCAFM